MLRIVQLYNHYVEDVQLDKRDFVCPPDDELEIVYTMCYMQGSFKDGELYGRWTFPGQSSTNGVMLWPDAMSFFYRQVEKYNPGFLDKQTNFIKKQQIH